MRYQRHIKDHMDWHHREVAEQLTQLFDSGQWKRMVLFGQERIVSNFKVFLPERVKQHITDTFPMNFPEERSKIILHALERLLGREMFPMCFPGSRPTTSLSAVQRGDEGRQPR